MVDASHFPSAGLHRALFLALAFLDFPLTRSERQTRLQIQREIRVARRSARLPRASQSSLSALPVPVSAPVPSSNSLSVSRPLFSTFDDLRRHTSKEHSLFYCDLCVEHLQLFSWERKTYTRAQLATHRITGDPEDRSHRGQCLTSRSLISTRALQAMRNVSSVMCAIWTRIISIGICAKTTSSVNCATRTAWRTASTSASISLSHIPCTIESSYEWQFQGVRRAQAAL